MVLPKTTPPAPVPATPANPEHIDADSITVNGQPRVALTTNLLTSQLGLPDSIAEGAMKCGSELKAFKGANGDFWYHGKTMYEVSGPQAILTTFDVTKGKFQGKLGQLVLNQNTTLEDVRRCFPLSAKDAEKPTSGRPEKEITLPFYHNAQPLDESLRLLFKNGRLQAVWFYSPC